MLLGNKTLETILFGLQGRTIFLSDSAVVARRDGELKFMFRIADIRPRYQVLCLC